MELITVDSMQTVTAKRIKLDPPILLGVLACNIAWKKVRDSQGQDFVIIANGGNGFFLKSNSGKVLCNGKQFERFSRQILRRR